MCYRLVAYISITHEPIFKNFILSDCRKAELYSRILVVVLRRFCHVEETIDKPAQIQVLDRNHTLMRTRVRNVSMCIRS